MKKQLLLLIALQDTDIKRLAIQNQMKALPEKLLPGKIELNKLESLLQDDRDRYEQTQQWRRDQETTLEREEEAIKRAKVKLQESASTRDYAAANRELETKRRIMSEREDEVLKVVEALDATKTLIEERDELVSTLRERIEEDEVEHSAVLNELNDTFKATNQERDTLLNTIDQEIISRYERIREKLGIALMPIVHGTCKGCYMNIPPQLNNIIVQQQSIETCPSCHRLIYAAEEDE